MSMVRFACLCDKCGKRSREYTPWSTCRECFDDVCPACEVHGENTEDEANRTLCQVCMWGPVGGRP